MKILLQKKRHKPITKGSFKSIVLIKVLAVLVILINATFGLAFAEKIQYDSGAKRDPMIPLIGPNGLISQKAIRSDLNIEGIILDPRGGSVAVINGDVYKAGDRIGEATVVQILQDRVLLTQDDEEKTVWLREEIIKKETPKG